ncbi:MAG: CoB--CoM heterodisulfide reductase iron-sulfur subunit B family protein [Desulfobacteraceae bacterium]|nr:CoB--CoM heterodisulfide reductase iron-sulfur subunit B family protein [Desulfobacteraceae bacterium]
MNYLYYPGCSLTGSAREYDVSTRALMALLGAELTEIEDWTCCGASAAEAVDPMLSLSLAGRNLALAETMSAGPDILVPCSACYLNLKRAEAAVREQGGALDDINTVLAGEGVIVNDNHHIRHLLDVLSRDVGADIIIGRRVRDLAGLAIAPYYGCQCLRPYAEFDDPENPASMEPLIAATGASVHRWSMGGKCCGASHMTTDRAVALELVGAILDAAAGADAVVTVCPMCQMNLEAFQLKISRQRRNKLDIPILYLPQLLGLSMGLPADTLALDLNLSNVGVFQN